MFSLLRTNTTFFNAQKIKFRDFSLSEKKAFSPKPQDGEPGAWVTFQTTLICVSYPNINLCRLHKHEMLK